ncbi:hypothetical protein D3C78_1348470 [compost metagenome]
MASAVAASSAAAVWNRSSRGNTSSTWTSALPRCEAGAKPLWRSTAATLPRTQGMLRTLSRYTGEVYRPMKRHSRSTWPDASSSRRET